MPFGNEARHWSTSSRVFQLTIRIEISKLSPASPVRRGRVTVSEFTRLLTATTGGGRRQPLEHPTLADASRFGATSPTGRAKSRR